MSAMKEKGLDGTFFLIDLEMGGEIGKALYLNTKTVKRPDGVWNHQPVRAEAMLNYFYKR